MKVGYIERRRKENGKEIFKYVEANATRRMGVRKDSVKIPFLIGTYDYEEIKSTTDILDAHLEMVIVNEPFFTDEERKKKMESWCKWANTCEHGEYSYFSDVVEDTNE